MSTLTLDFDVARQPLATAPYQAHSETSRAAAQEIQKTLGPKQRTVLEMFARRDWTDNELTRRAALDHGWSLNTARPRRIELTKLGFLANTGQRRDRSTVWSLTPAGRSYLDLEAWRQYQRQEAP